MKKRWISLYVENQIGVLAKIAGLFSSKSYNLDSLTVGTTADPTISRMTIGVISDDATFEQIKKQLNRCVEVIKVLDFTAVPIRHKELLFIKALDLTEAGKNELFHIAEVFGAKVADYGKDSVLLQNVESETRNDDLIRLLRENYKNIEVVRGGTVAIDAISKS